MGLGFRRFPLSRVVEISPRPCNSLPSQILFEFPSLCDRRLPGRVTPGYGWAGWLFRGATRIPERELILREGETKRAERQRAYEVLQAYYVRRVGEFERAVWLPWIDCPRRSPTAGASEGVTVDPFSRPSSKAEEYSAWASPECGPRHGE